MSRIWILGILDQAIMIPIVLIYSIIVLATVVLTPYVKFKLVVENQKFSVAVKESIMLAVSQPTVTLRLALV